MDESIYRLSRQERVTLRRIEEDLAREDPLFAASLSGSLPGSAPGSLPGSPARTTARQYRWPRVCRLRARSYVALGVGLMVVAATVHQALSLALALTCFGAAVARRARDA
jgi:hypothetical protein